MKGDRTWNKIFPPKKGDRVRITMSIYPDEKPSILGKEGIIEMISALDNPEKPYGIRLDLDGSHRLVWVQKQEIERI